MVCDSSKFRTTVQMYLQQWHVMCSSVPPWDWLFCLLRCCSILEPLQAIYYTPNAVVELLLHRNILPRPRRTQCSNLTVASDFELLRLHSIVVRDFELLRDIWRWRWRLAAFGHSTSQINDVVFNLQKRNVYETVCI